MHGRSFPSHVLPTLILGLGLLFLTCPAEAWAGWQRNGECDDPRYETSNGGLARPGTDEHDCRRFGGGLKPEFEKTPMIPVGPDGINGYGTGQNWRRIEREEARKANRAMRMLDAQNGLDAPAAVDGIILGEGDGPEVLILPGGEVIVWDDPDARAPNSMATPYPGRCRAAVFEGLRRRLGTDAIVINGRADRGTARVQGRAYQFRCEKSGRIDIWR